MVCSDSLEKFGRTLRSKILHVHQLPENCDFSKHPKEDPT